MCKAEGTVKHSPNASIAEPSSSHLTVISSSVKNLARPLTTCRGAASPRSISSTYKLEERGEGKGRGGGGVEGARGGKEEGGVMGQDG